MEMKDNQCGMDVARTNKGKTAHAHTISLATRLIQDARTRCTVFSRLCNLECAL